MGELLPGGAWYERALSGGGKARFPVPGVFYEGLVDVYKTSVDVYKGSVELSNNAGESRGNAGATFGGDFVLFFNFIGGLS